METRTMPHGRSEAARRSLPGRAERAGRAKRAGGAANAETTSLPNAAHPLGHLTPHDGRAFHPDRHTRRQLARTFGLAVTVGLLVLAIDSREAYWLCVPALLLATGSCRTRRGTAASALTVMAAAALPTALHPGAHGLPSLPLAVLVPVLSAGSLLATRERLESERDAMRRSALTDPLTGLANRRSLLARTEYEIARHRRARRPFAVLMLDLDGFKALNDRFGHPAGDDLLREVGVAISRVIRAQDTVARLGGDEFCVLAPETDLTGAHDLADRVVAGIRTVTVGIDVIGASVGAAAYPHDGRNTSTLLDIADRRLLDAKRMRARRRRRRTVAKDLQPPYPPVPTTVTPGSRSARSVLSRNGAAGETATDDATDPATATATDPATSTHPATAPPTGPARTVRRRSART